MAHILSLFAGNVFLIKATLLACGHLKSSLTKVGTQIFDSKLTCADENLFKILEIEQDCGHER